MQNQTITAGSTESAEGAGGKDLINSVKNDFTAQLKKLTALVNTAIEKCLIYENAAGDSQSKLQTELSGIEKQLLQNPLAEIIRLATPSAKAIATGTDKPYLSFYQLLKKELEEYKL